MKLIFTLVFVYLAYKYFFERPQIRPPRQQDYHPPRYHSSQQTPNHQRRKNAQDTEDYIDYEEVE